MPITAKRRRFAEEFVIDFNGTQAAIRAGCPITSAYTTAHDMIMRPEVQAIIRKELEHKSKVTQFKATDAANYWLDLARADARELNPTRVACCRYCWGVDFRYQYTLNEQRARMWKHQEQQLVIKNERLRKDFDEEGGDQYDRLREPNTECPECRGDGTLILVPPDLSKISRGAIMLFDGIKVSANGSVEIKLRDRSHAMARLEVLLGFVAPARPLTKFNPQDLGDEELDSILHEAVAKGFLKLPGTTDATGQPFPQSQTIEGVSEAVLVEDES